MTKPQTFKKFIFEEANELNDLDSKKLGQLKSVKRLNSNEEGEKGEGNSETNLNRQGLIRTVKNAHLVYKRQNETETYDELWMYGSSGNALTDESELKTKILSGTDIPPDKQKSDDGEQYYEMWNAGTVIFLKIFNLPN